MSTNIAVALVALITLGSPVWAQNSSAASSSKSGLMTPEDLTSVPAQAPDERVTYGADANQFAELRLPSGAGPHPVVVLVHGGCFKTYGSFADLAAMGDALKGRGIATLNVEYRGSIRQVAAGRTPTWTWAMQSIMFARLRRRIVSICHAS